MSLHHLHRPHRHPRLRRWEKDLVMDLVTDLGWEMGLVKERVAEEGVEVAEKQTRGRRRR